MECHNHIGINILIIALFTVAGIQTNGTKFYKSVQLLACADDTDIIAGSQPSLKEDFLRPEGAATRMGLRVNQRDTNYMITSQNAKQSENITICNYTFEVVHLNI